MADEEGVRLGLHEAESWVVLVALLDLVQEPRIAAFRHKALLVQSAQQAGGSPRDTLHAGLVIGVVEMADFDALGFVELLFLLEEIVVEVKLELLVRVIDTQLLETVHFERLEPRTGRNACFTVEYTGSCIFSFQQTFLKAVVCIMSGLFCLITEDLKKCASFEIFSPKGEQLRSS